MSEVIFTLLWLFLDINVPGYIIENRIFFFIIYCAKGPSTEPWGTPIVSLCETPLLSENVLYRCQIQYSNKKQHLKFKDQRAWEKNIKSVQMRVARDKILKVGDCFYQQIISACLHAISSVLRRNQMADRRIQEQHFHWLSIQQSFFHSVPTVWVSQSILILFTNYDRPIESRQFNTQLKLWKPHSQSL